MVRIGGTVVVAGEWGVVEDITLTFLAVRTWDERRIAMPVSYYSKKWDGRGWDLAVTGTAPSTIVVRVIVTAKDPDDLWTVRRAVREQLVAWLAEEHPDALPRILPDPAPGAAPAPDAPGASAAARGRQ
ncbi:hypothetical protein M2167_006580 [Streptomyces sp. SPB4]|nr:hypothetical protein [Streptomyces sp. SPB4]